MAERHWRSSKRLLHLKDNMSAMKENIPQLITKLESIDTRYAYERRYIGEAATYLRFLYDIIDSIDSKDVQVKQTDETYLG